MEALIVHDARSPSRRAAAALQATSAEIRNGCYPPIAMSKRKFGGGSLDPPSTLGSDGVVRGRPSPMYFSHLCNVVNFIERGSTVPNL